jgi:phospholipase/carboxylesterase
VLRARVLLLVLVLAGCDKSAPEPAPPVRLAPSAAAPKSPSGLRVAADLEYLELVTGGANADERLPLIVAVHGLGDTPQGFAGLFDGFDARARVALPRAPDAHGPGWSWFSYRAEIGEAELARGIDKATERLARAIDDVARTRPTLGRPIVTGFSQGGMLSFAVATERPSLVRAAFPIGGALPEPLWPASAPPKRHPLRIVALHGEADTLVPLAPTRRAVDALTQRGFDTKLETFPGVAHSVPEPMRARWMALLREELARN